MRATRVAAAALLAAFAVLALFRFNGFSLLEPDSPAYVIEAKALASFEGYREIDRPGQPPQTFRPPGLPVLLAPLAWVAPGSIAAAKSLVLATALLALGLATALAARGGSGAEAIAALALIASSPYALLHATEVATEFPYLAVSLAAILIATAHDDPPSKREIAVVAALLAFLPFVRTIGVALIAALLAWCLLDRKRRGWLPAPLSAIVVTALWMARNHFAGGPTYFGSVVAGFKQAGAAGFATRSARNAVFYAERFVDVLLPGARPGRPMYERMTIGGAPDLGGLHGFVWVAAAAIVAFAVWGAWSRRRRDGSLIAVYAAGFIAILAVYPPKHERLLWPLVPIVWTLVPAGVAAVSGVARAVRARPVVLAATIAGMAGAAALLAWQTSATLGLVADNRAWAGGGASFYERRVPPLYFADWREAGTWLRAHADPKAHVLTRHSDVYLTSGLTQDSIRFEELPPPVWRARIAALGARYLVVPTSTFGKFFPLDLSDSDPAYRYEIVWRGSDVAVISVSPNRTGRVVPPPAPSNETVAACEAAAAREPSRVDLITRCAELAAASGRRAEAIDRLEKILAAGGADVRVAVTLGQLLLDERRDDEASKIFAAAADMPEADLLAQTIERGRRAAGELAAARSVDKLLRARSAVVRARLMMDNLRWAEAHALIQEALAFQPYDPIVASAAGELLARVGEFGTALPFFDQAGHEGDEASAAKAASLKAAMAADQDAAGAPPDAIVAAAAFFSEIGMPGKSLDLLERAAATRPGDAEIARSLAGARRFFGLE